MTTILTLFVLSMLVLSGLVLSKVFEIKVRKIHFLSNLFLRGDKKIHQMIELAFSKSRLYKRILNIFIFEFLPSYLYEILVRMKDFVSKKYYEVGGFNGRRILRSNGSVSFFLEQLARDNSFEKES
ncbi:MAG TPA: hypothetical protein VJC13_01455 [Candidatus Paceibacterota bacterium]